MAYGLSKLHQSTEIVDNNGATQGTIIHTGNVSATVGTPTTTFLASATSATTFSIAPSNGLDSLVIFAFAATGVKVPTIVQRLEDISTTANFTRLYQGSNQVCSFNRNADGTQITISSLATGVLQVYEVILA